MRIFQVIIHYKGSEEHIKVKANDDLQARAKAIEIDRKAYKDAGVTQPKVIYCETELKLEFHE